jgi:hypothetical protein
MEELPLGAKEAKRRRKVAGIKRNLVHTVNAR